MRLSVFRHMLITRQNRAILVHHEFMSKCFVRFMWVLVGALGCGNTSVEPHIKRGRGAPPIVTQEFLRAEGDQLRLGDRTVRLIGVNASLVHGRSTREAMPRVLHSMGRDTLSIARVWALGESEGDEAWRRNVAFRLGADTWVDESFEHLDHVIAEASANRIRLVLVLINRWADRGGLPQYARWTGVEPRNRNLLPSEEAHVLSSEAVQALFLAHVERVVGRVNSITGIAYNDDPTIAAWEVFNEMGARTCAMQEGLVAWTRVSAQKIRELDSNHLIAPGHIGYNSEQSLRFWREIHAMDEVDYADTHGYPQNLLNATDPDRLGAWLGHRAAEARELQKPIIVGEVGVPREWNREGAERERSRWLDRFLHHADRNGTDAVMVWIYRGDERDDPHGIWAWGPYAEETAPVRHLLQDWSKRWLREDTELDPQAPSDFPLGLEGIRPFVHGEAESEEWVVSPWELSEGCVNDQHAWTTYSIPWRDDVSEFAFTFGEARRGRVQVRLGAVVVGHWIDGRFHRSDAALPSGPWAWLRLDAEDDDGRAVLRAFTRTLPASETLRLTIR